VEARPTNPRGLQKGTAYPESPNSARPEAISIKHLPWITIVAMALCQE
jgi:hypothetical protein